MARLRDALSPCRIDQPKGARRHPRSTAHAAFVESYRLARHAWEQAREEAAIGYATENAEFARDHPPPTLRGWMDQHPAHHPEEQ